jgi:SAM-dependent methyltransferase
MQYQSFPGVRGSSESLEKLKALCLPSLKGKRFVDLGCNEGYFCGYALFDGAGEVIGIDQSEPAIRRAQARFPDGTFLAQSWEKLPEGNFDVVLLASALHYATDQEALVHSLMARLNSDGVLILEIGVITSSKSEWVKVKRSIDERLFPTRSKLVEILEPYAWKIVSRSVAQAGDPVARFVVHVRAMRPFAYLMLENPGAGKSTIARTLFTRSKVPVVSGDVIYQRIKDGRLEVSPALKEAVLAGLAVGGHDQAALKALSAGLVQALVDIWCTEAGPQDFALDSYVPSRYHRAVAEAFESRGYVPVQLSWDMERSASARDEANIRAEHYFKSLTKRSNEIKSPTFMVRRIPSARLKSTIFKWHLDYPADGQVFENSGKVQLAGWMLPIAKDPGKYRCYVRSGPAVEYFEFNRQRDDVVQRFGQQAPLATGQAGFHGFAHTLPPLLAAAGFEFGFELGGEQIPVARISVRTPSSPNLFMARIKQELRTRLAKVTG